MQESEINKMLFFPPKRYLETELVQNCRKRKKTKIGEEREER